MMPCNPYLHAVTEEHTLACFATSRVLSVGPEQQHVPVQDTSDGQAWLHIDLPSLIPVSDLMQLLQYACLCTRHRNRQLCLAGLRTEAALLRSNIVGCSLYNMIYTAALPRPCDDDLIGNYSILLACIVWGGCCRGTLLD